MFVRLHALDYASKETYGSKAWRLFQALQRGYRVPAGVVVPASECEGVMARWRAQHTALLDRLVGEASPGDCVRHPDARELTLPAAFVQQLARAVRALRAEREDSCLIVRSSAQAEDSGVSSQAGQFYSESNLVSDQEVGLAISRVLVNYLWMQQRQLAAGAMAVLVQVQVTPDLGGVAFSCDPVSGDPDEMVVGCEAGGGGRVADGVASAVKVSIRLGQADEWEVSHHTGDGGALERDGVAEPLASEIARALIDLERLLESPVDIEWAVAQAEFYLLQVRPVTRVAFWQGPLADLSPHEGTYDRAATRPLHPHSWYWLGVGDRANAEAFSRFGEDHLQCTHRVVNGYAYRSIRVDRARYDRNREQELVLREAPAALAGWEEGKARFLCRLRLLNRDSLTVLLLPELKARYGDVVALATYAQRAHDTLQRPVRIASGWVHELAERLAGYGEMQSVALLDEPGPLEVEFVDRVSALSAVMDGSTVPTDQLQDIACDYGYQLTSFDDLYGPLSWKTWEEDLTPLRLLCAAHWQGGGQGEREARRQHVLEARRALLTHAKEADPDAGALLQRVMDLAVRYMGVRVDKDLCLSFAFAVHRKYLSALGVRVFGQDAYQRIWGATMEEVMEFCASDGDTFPPRTLAAIERRCRHHHAFEKMLAPSQLPVAPQSAEQEAETAVRDVLEGTPGAAGTAVGRVRVLRDVREVAALDKGEIMVIPDIKPVWALAFSLASGIISADGFLLAHGAIMAREAGIPCVFVGDAVNSLHTGDLVRVLGEQGRVEVLSRAM